MSEEITASEAERRYGITDKTIRDWIKQGILPARHLTKTKLAIAVDDIEAIARERGYLGPARHLHQEQLLGKIEELEDRIADLEVEVKLLHDRIASLERIERIPLTEFSQADLQPRITHTVPSAYPKDPLPEGCVLATHFAKLYGVSRGTIRDQLDKGKIAFESRPKPGRTGETERYFTPGQQHAALAYWRDRGHLA